ncbi:putative glycolipid-binding domain-containing protein [Yoonia sp. F2084L]|uniref:putative glycolipid-binding domain-containing protein n=1 Tax=Yoonia sp. F2084L TaxID=2926419 RepID=UPI001FF415AE|nr:putative glycolipid-binding domain-containing protein [Yoonia sp. F2084L]MCK0096893.1 putative glycolipid-binding domain-containing protein [Yoonia sp. F2084L]
MTTYDLTWQWVDGGGDRASVMVKDDGWFVSGQHGSTCYWLTTDQDGAAQTVEVALDGPEDHPAKLALRRDAFGWHHADGTLIEQSIQAYDVDIACTALTNTLPIRRLNLGPEESAEIDVLYIPIPALKPHVVRQHYRRTPTGYLYENRDSGFRANLTVDTAGWVTDYPGVCHLTEGAP